MISGAGLCWQHVGGVGSTTTTTTTTIVVVFEEDVLRLTCGYAPQSGISL